MMPGNATVGTTLLDEEMHRLLIRRERECMEQQYLNATVPPETYCPMIFDGWSCWPNTPAGATAYAACPAFITGFDTT